jgi:hypothetical protein
MEIPRSAEAEKLLPDDVKRQYKTLVGEYCRKYPIGYMEFPVQLEKKRYYRDRAHFNEAGGWFYSSWLVGRLCHETI